MNIEDLKQQVANRDENPVTNHSVAERAKARAEIAAQTEAFFLAGGAVRELDIQKNNKPTLYNTAYGVNAK